MQGHYDSSGMVAPELDLGPLANAMAAATLPLVREAKLSGNAAAAAAAATSLTHASEALTSGAFALVKHVQEHARADVMLMQQRVDEVELEQEQMRRDFATELAEARAKARAEAEALTSKLQKARTTIEQLEAKAEQEALKASRALKSSEEARAATQMRLEGQLEEQKAAAAAEKAVLSASFNGQLAAVRSQLATSRAETGRLLEEQRRLQAHNRDLEERLRQLRAESEGIIAELTAEIEKLRDLMKQAVRPTAPPSLWSKLQLESLKKPSTLPTLAPAPPDDELDNDQASPPPAAAVLPPATVPPPKPAVAAARVPKPMKVVLEDGTRWARTWRDLTGELRGGVAALGGGDRGAGGGGKAPPPRAALVARVHESSPRRPAHPPGARPMRAGS